MTDIILPKGMYGTELARLARLRLPDITVLFMSGYPRDAVVGDRMLDAARGRFPDRCAPGCGKAGLEGDLVPA